MDIRVANKETEADDLTTISTFMKEEVGDDYHGYAEEKKRVGVVGGRNEGVDATGLHNVFTALIDESMQCSHTYWTFVGFHMGKRC